MRLLPPLVSFAALCFVPAARCIWPQPSFMTTGKEVRSITTDFSIAVPEAYSRDSDLAIACQRALGRLHTLSLRPYVVDRGASLEDPVKKSHPLKRLKISIKDQHQDQEQDTAAFDIQWNEHAVNQSVVQFMSNDDIRHQKRNSPDTPISVSTLTKQSLGELDESYELDIPFGGHDAHLTARSALGALRGLATFTQLAYKLPKSGILFVQNLPVTIRDKPAFPYRGVLIDTSRNYLPIESIKKTVDVMETVKLNQLHWHITDSQSFPLLFSEASGLDVLAKTGAYEEGEVYDKAMVQDIVEYAAMRGVNIVPEIDMPGHMKAGIDNYGDGSMIACNEDKMWVDWANEPPSGHLDIRLPAATGFARKLVKEAATFFPGKYFSTGNDEVKPQCYGLKGEDKAGVDTLLAPFVQSVHGQLTDLERTPVVWEEAVIDFPQTGKVLPKGTLVEAWISNTSVVSILKSRDDIDVLLAISDYFYLDCGAGSWISNNSVGQSWCNYVSWQKMYSFDPFAGTEGIANVEQRIKGGESAAWAEQIDSGNLDSILWPRAASGAEIFWTGAEYEVNGKKEKRSLLQAEPRIHDVRGRIRASGVMASPLQPFYCVLRPGRCLS